jgi:osmotically-inducible protein OsmY
MISKLRMLPIAAAAFGMLGIAVGGFAIADPQDAAVQDITSPQAIEPAIAGALVVSPGVLPNDQTEDAAVTANVKNAIAASVGASAAKINVETRVAIVTLSGEVSSVAIRDRAREAAMFVSGVVDVIDRIAVTSTG